MKNSNSQDDEKRIIVVGAGAGGMMAAGRAAELGGTVLLLEKTDQAGKKLLISGKTRCNLTNAKDLEPFLAMYGANGPFLRQVFHRYFREELLFFFRQYGVETKVERGGRIFPVSDDARDVVTALKRCLSTRGVTLSHRSRVKGIVTEGGRVTGVQTEQQIIPAAAVVLATGGATWPETGSSGDGYQMAAALGHKVTHLRPALVPLVVEDRELAKSMQGVSLRNVRLTAFPCPAAEIDMALTPDEDSGRGMVRKPPAPVIESRLGEMMLTHFGLGGPITLLMSLSIVDALDRGPVSVAIDLKPALNREQLRLRLQRDFDQFSKRSFRRLLAGLLPAKMVDPVVALTGIACDKPAHQITAAEREGLLNHLKALRFNILRPLSMAAAIVTAGGVSLKEVDPRTMASRLLAGLYFCGEVLDIDADTGGYNLQAAFSTGHIAGEQAAAFVKKWAATQLP
jgi:predicted flavoprotein YhiN